MNAPVIIFPCPKSINKYDKASKAIDLSNGIRIITQAKSQKAQRKLCQVLRRLNIPLVKEAGAVRLRFVFDGDYAGQQYRLTVSPDGIDIVYGDERGAFYGVITLCQVLRQTRPYLPCIEVDDAPDFVDRGLMLDISRNKVPKLKTLLRLVDFLAEIKVNQLQLYIEGLSFYYESFGQYYRNGNDFLTAADIIKLDKYCANNFIELVPTQNSFGHFTEWLAKDELKPLAELSEPFLYEGVTEMLPSTLNPLKSESVEFISRLCGDLLPSFSSDKINVCGDEPFELGLGASKEICEQRGKGNVYVDFMSKIFAEARKFNKSKIMMFGDVIKNYPDLISKLPKDIIALEWGYNDDSFNDKICRIYADSGIEYYVCPGTSMWNTVAGKTDFMLANIKGAAHYGLKNGARGLLNTDWGDGGTCQQFGLTLLPYAAGAAYAWNADSDQDRLLCDYLDKFVYLDEENKAAKLIYDLGNYYQKHSVDFNATKIFKMLYIQQTDHINFGTNYEPLFKIKDRKLLTSDEYQATKDYLDGILATAQTLNLQCDDGALIKEEIIWSASYLRHGCLLGLFMTDYNAQTENMLHQLSEEIISLLAEYKSIWHKRNKKSALALSILRMQALRNKYGALIKSINKI